MNLKVWNYHSLAVGMAWTILIGSLLCRLTNCDLSYPDGSPSAIFSQRPQPYKEQSLHQKILYISPWEESSYAFALRHAAKFDIIVPCWYEISFKTDHIFIDSDSNYNPELIYALRAANPAIKIYPRIYIAGPAFLILKQIGGLQTRFNQTVALISGLINVQEVDGFVFDSNHNLFLKDSATDATEVQIRNLIYLIINQIKHSMVISRTIFLSIPNLHQSKVPFTNIAFDRYASLMVEGFILDATTLEASWFQQFVVALEWTKVMRFKHFKYFLTVPLFSVRKHLGINSRRIKQLYDAGQLTEGQFYSGYCVFHENGVQSTIRVPCEEYFRQVGKLARQNSVGIAYWEAGTALERQFSYI